MSSRNSALRAFLLVVVLAIAGGVAGFTAASVSPREYQATGTYVVVPSPTITETEAIVRSFDSLQAQGIIPTLLELYRSTSIHREVAGSVGIEDAALEDEYTVTADVLSNSNTVEITVTGPDPELVAAFAERLGSQGAQRFESMYRIYEVSTLDEPTLPKDPAGPGPVQLAVVGGFVGLLLGLALAGFSLRRRPGQSWS